MDFPEDLKYTKEHEWVKVDGDTVTIGITHFAQEELGEIVFVELPSVGDSFKQSDSFCVVESTKAASDVYAPVSGEVAEVNSALSDAPDQINNSPYSDGWMVKFSGVDAAELGDLMSVEEYKALVEK